MFLPSNCGREWWARRAEGGGREQTRCRDFFEQLTLGTTSEQKKFRSLLLPVILCFRYQNNDGLVRRESV